MAEPHPYGQRLQALELAKRCRGQLREGLWNLAGQVTIAADVQRLEQSWLAEDSESSLERQLSNSWRTNSWLDDESGTERRNSHPRW
ncbi:hypothetical protein OsJ_31698 [Oryza sativa Japonica Group]|uniref:Uncharacterized protein n=1 Tax=Oryza sativa subsp. japonica TaxID=39947 RepID=B9G5Z5_ORYSJ|nr:hypothetical protein OsJ_31698 [Oryza sativa Japonica Group]